MKTNNNTVSFYESVDSLIYGHLPNQVIEISNIIRKIKDHLGVNMIMQFVI